MKSRPSSKVLLPVLVGGAAVLAMIAAPAAFAATTPTTTAVTASTATVSTATASAAAADTSASVSAFGKMVQNVTKQVLAKYPHAYLMEIDGSSPSGPVKSVDKVTTWRFVFNDLQDGSVHQIVFATVHLPDQTPTFTTENGIWVGSDQVTHPVTMSLGQAQALLQKAGYTGSFEYVTFRQPIAGGFTPHPLYIFGQLGPTGYVAVDSVTGAVAPIK